jgi:hypothetical protein
VSDTEGKTLVSALLPAKIGTYRAPSWLRERAGKKSLRWRVRALDESGQQVGESTWRNLSFAEPERPE